MTETITIVADDPQAQEHSDRLKQQIRHRIEQLDGWISFADFMHACLYWPGLGYYSAGSHKLGAEGDFTTAPELSGLFGKALAHHVADVGRQLEQFEILEFGAGSGQLAIDVLEQLSLLDCLPDRYLILETSADLRQRQQARIAEYPHLMDRIQWLSTLPEAFNGVALANEVCDAMPVHLLRFSTESVVERGVIITPDGFAWQDRALDNSRLVSKASAIRERIGSQMYQTEVNLFAEDWLHSVAASLSQGAIFIIDYGYPFAEFYRPERTAGTLRCYYRHHAHDNPLLLPGLQDITAHIDFTALATQAQNAGLDVAGFHEQGDFLLAGEMALLAAELESQLDPLEWLQHSSVIKQLLMPDAMGHQFKVLSLTRGIDTLPRLQHRDRRYQL